jgi:hypothetical protein
LAGAIEHIAQAFVERHRMKLYVNGAATRSAPTMINVIGMVGFMDKAPRVPVARQFGKMLTGA